MAYHGAGTWNSPISFEDSEDEVIQELSYNQFHASSASASPDQPTFDRGQQVPAFDNHYHQHVQSEHVQAEKKRKRANSSASHDVSRAGPSNNHSPSILENRISQLETKKARKRRRKLERHERQAQAEGRRLSNIDWLNNSIPLPGPSILPLPQLWNGKYLYPDNLQPESSSSVTQGPHSEIYVMDDTDRDDFSFPPSSRPPGSDWVSSMAMAAEGIDPISPSVQTPPPQILLPPMPPPTIRPPIHASKVKPLPPVPSKVVEQHSLPPKPPPPHSAPPIGMMPDQDANSKHGIFQITDFIKEGGSGMKKKSSPYIPNPARTLVMEQLPKANRNVDFVNNWSRTACGALAVHIFVDPPSAKALVEFATADLARKAWASPKLGQDLAKFPPHQIKGKPRTDLIKVWWYRVDGVGADAGVGEIEEGEIEEDAVAENHFEVATPPERETKKQRKARAAKLREERASRVLELRKQQEDRTPALSEQVSTSDLDAMYAGVENVSQTMSMLPLNDLPLPSLYPSSDYPLPPYMFQPVFPALAPLPPGYSTSPFPPVYLPPTSQNWQYSATQSSLHPATAYGASLPSGSRAGYDDNASIASSRGRSGSPAASVVVVSTSGQGDDLDDYEEVDMDMDVDDLLQPPMQVVITAHPPTTLPPPLPPSSVTTPIHHSLPARPPTLKVASAPKGSTVQSRQAQPREQPRAAFSRNGTQLSTAGPASSRTTYSILQRKTKLQMGSQASVSALSGPPPLPISEVQPSTSGSTPSIIVSSVAAASPAPSEPKAMKNAPTQPSFTKRALIARQKELEQSIAKSKLDLAARKATSHSQSSQLQSTVKQSQPPQVEIPAWKPSMDLGGKQAMEDRLRKLVLESKSKRAAPPASLKTNLHPQAATPSPMTDVTAASSPSPQGHVKKDFFLTSKPIVATGTSTPSPNSSSPASQQGQAVNFFSTSTSTIATPTPKPLSTSTTPTSTVSVSTSLHSFSLEDLAVSFITETIETIKANPHAPSPALPTSASVSTTSASVPSSTSMSPAPPPLTPVIPVSAAVPHNITTVGPNSNPLVNNSRQPNSVMSDLAAKQKRLQQHINDSKLLMEQLSDASTKEEKDRILKIMKEKSRQFEENKAIIKPPITTIIEGSFNSRTQTPVTQQLYRWPVNRQDSGVLILSDDEDEDED